MTKNQEAFKEAEKEFKKDQITEIKNIMKNILQKIQDEKEKKERAEENIRLLKLDMDDLRNGKIEKIQERHDKSKKARDISPIHDNNIMDLVVYSSYSPCGTNAVLTTTSASALNWADATGGTYNISCSNGTTKEFNL
jgi:hypothetical protein